MEPERLILEADSAGPVRGDDVLQFGEHVLGGPVARSEPGVVRAEDAPERAAAVREDRERLDAREEIPRGERKRVVVVEWRASRPRHDRVPAARDQPRDHARVAPACDRVGKFAREQLSLAHTAVVERGFLHERLRPDGVHVCAADHDRELWTLCLDPPRQLGGSRVLDRHAGDAEEIRRLPRDASDYVPDGEAIELALEDLHLMSRRPQRRGYVSEAETGCKCPVPIELAARRRLDERNPHRGAAMPARTRNPRASRWGNSTDEKPAARSRASASDSLRLKTRQPWSA